MSSKECTVNADKILYSKKIYRGYGEELLDGGVAIKGDKIVAVGSKDQIKAFEKNGVEIMDYGQQFLMPGFIDNHQHYAMDTFLECYNLDLFGMPSQEAILEKVREFYKEYPDIPLIYGMGWQLMDWGEGAELPDKRSLDAITTDIPICLGTADGWMFWCNSKSMELFGYTKGNTPEVFEENVWKFDDGEPNGILYANACEATYYVLFDLAEEDTKKLIEDGFKKYISFGVTSIGDVSGEYNGPVKEPIGYDILDKMYKGDDGKWMPRAFVYPSMGHSGDYSVGKSLMEKYKTGKLQMRGLKAYIDGVVPMETSVMLEPYITSDTCGEPLYDQDELNRLVAKANAEGFAVRIHSTGDGGTRMCLNAYEYSLNQNGEHGLRNCVEHIEYVSDEDAKRFAQLGVIASIQPAHLVLDENVNVYIGDDRAYNGHPFRKLLDAGATVSISTDAPVVSCDPRENLYVAVTRRDDAGRLICSKPNEEMTIWEVLTGYTYLSAYTLGKEEELGSLDKGKLADIVVLGKDITSIEPKEILDTKIVMTMIGGEVVYNG